MRGGIYIVLGIGIIGLAVIVFLFALAPQNAGNDALASHTLALGVALSLVISFCALALSAFMYFSMKRFFKNQQENAGAIERTLDDFARQSQRHETLVSNIDNRAQAKLDQAVEQIMKLAPNNEEDFESLEQSEGDARAKNPSALQRTDTSANMMPLAQFNIELMDENHDQKFDRNDDEYAVMQLRQALEKQRLELALQPIIKASKNAPGGFEVFCVLEDKQPDPMMVRRLKKVSDDNLVGDFERLMIMNGAQTARQQLGQSAQDMPLQVAISAPFLRNQNHISDVSNLYENHSGLHKTLYLSVEFPHFNAKQKQYFTAFDKLQNAGVHFACEGWSGPLRYMEKLANYKVKYLKISTHRLLDRTKISPQEAIGSDIVTAAQSNGLQIIATGVEHDEDGVCLIDMGIELMIGPHFSLPKRVRQNSH